MKKNRPVNRKTGDRRSPSITTIARDPAAYGRWLHRRIRKQLESPRRRPGALLVLSIAVAMVGVLFYWGVIVASVPTVNELREARYVEASIAYTADGEELTRYQTRNHVRVTIDEIAPPVVEALIATEDHRFYSHGGIDTRRAVTSLWRTIQGNRQGGSTITMQLARNAFPELQGHFVVRRKVEEWLTARRIERMYEKGEILEMYLNVVPFMYEAFGIEAGARTYFQKSAAELDALESAVLVGMLKGTVFYNPVRNAERAHERRNIVLAQMNRHGYLDDETYLELREQPIELNFRRLDRADNRAPFFTEYLRLWLDEWAEENGYNLYTSGLQIYTTIDSRLQEAAENAVRDVAEDLQAVADVEWSSQNIPLSTSSAAAYRQRQGQVQPFSYFWQQNPALLDARIRSTGRFQRAVAGGLEPDSALVILRENEAFVDSVRAATQRLEAGFVAIHPRTGHVKAWVGGRDFRQNQYDHVALSKRQPGSTFKPFVYTAALERGFSPEDRIRDEVRAFNDGTGRVWRPQNVGGSSGGLVTLTDGLARSLNTVTAQLTAEVSPARVVDTARRMGIESNLAEVLSVGLGTSDVSLLEMTAAYATIANRGQYRRPHFILHIEDRFGNPIARFHQETRQAISPGVAYTVLDMMRGVVDYGTGQRIRYTFGGRGDLAGKTGTTQNHADGWFMLMHPDLVMGAWVGFDNPAIRFRSSQWGQGARNALPVVGTFLRQADLPDVAFSPPPGYAPRRSTRVLTAEELTTTVDSLLRDTVDAAASRAQADSILYREVEGQEAADSLNRSQRVTLPEGEAEAIDADAENPLPADTARIMPATEQID